MTVLLRTPLPPSMLYTMAWVPMASLAFIGATFSMVISLAFAGIIKVAKVIDRRRLRRKRIPAFNMAGAAADTSGMSNNAPRFGMPTAAAGPNIPTEAAAQWLPIDPAEASPGDIVVFDDNTTATALGNGKFRSPDGQIKASEQIRPIKEILRIGLGAGGG